MAAGNGRLKDERNLELLHQTKKKLAKEWQVSQGNAREGELRAQPSEIKEEFKKFYKRLPVSQWDLLSGNYELQPLTHFQKKEKLNVFKYIGIGLAIGAAVLISLAIVLLQND